jgi:hypothetical protein
MKKITFYRTELYTAVWAEPMTSLAKKYGISAWKLRQICTELGVPLPNMGHWQRLQHGVEVSTIELPPNYPGLQEYTLTIKDRDSHHETVKLPKKRKLHGSTQDLNLRFKVPSKLKNPDNLVIQARESLLLKSTPLGHDSSLIGTRSGYVSIIVSPKNVKRALRLMDAFIKLIKTRGHGIKIIDDTSYVLAYGEQIAFCLQEKLRIEETTDKHGWRHREYFPTGILTFRIWSDFRFYQKIFSDGKETVESQFPTILLFIEASAKAKKEKRLEREAEQEKHKEELRIARENEEHKEEEFDRFRDLFVQANLLHKANILREYIKTVETNATSEGRLSAELKEWIGWARNKIDWFDPSIARKDQLLDDNHRKRIYSELINELKMVV